jgi:hypothetical protein
MNPATPAPLTVLLIPPPGDTALLADEAGGGRVPWARQTWREDYGSPDGGTWSEEWTIGDADTSHEPAPHTGLILVLDGAPVAMGCDRAARWHRRSQPFAARHPHIPLVWTVAYARDVEDYCRSAGCRVVLLRDGREVES